MANWTDFLDPDGPDGAYLPWKKVEPRVGISRTTAWRLQKAGDFPKPYVVSPGRVAYRESEVEAWKVSRGHRSVATSALKASPAKAAEPAPAATAEPPRWMPPVKPEPFGPEQPASPPEQTRRPIGAAARARRKPPNTDQMSFDF